MTYLPPSSQGEFIPDPEWVMLGVTQPGGVVVFASRRLTLAELRPALDHFTEFDPFRRVTRNEFGRSWEMSVTMNDVYWATGTSYGDAIRRLFETWSPDDGSPVSFDNVRPEIGPARPALEDRIREPGGPSNRETGIGWGKRA